MWAHPGKKLLFMGGEIGQRTEWSFATELDWEVLAHPGHRALQSLIRRLNVLHKQYAALAELDHDPRGFAWIDANDAPQSVASFIRFASSQLHARPTGDFVVFVGNFTPVVRHGYRLGVPRDCDYLEVLNTDAAEYGGSNTGNMGRVRVEPVASHGHAQSIRLTLPPLGVLYLVPADPGLASDEELAQEARYRAERAKAKAQDDDGLDHESLRDLPASDRQTPSGQTPSRGGER
jgi:1,4-alpha-glucan branching enzyme